MTSKPKKQKEKLDPGGKKPHLSRYMGEQKLSASGPVSAAWYSGVPPGGLPQVHWVHGQAELIATDQGLLGLPAVDTQELSDGHVHGAEDKVPLGCGMSQGGAALRPPLTAQSATWEARGSSGA